MEQLLIGRLEQKAFQAKYSWTAVKASRKNSSTPGAEVHPL